MLWKTEYVSGRNVIYTFFRQFGIRKTSRKISRAKRNGREIDGYIRKELIHFAYTYNIYHRVSTQAHYINMQCIFRHMLKFAKRLSRYLWMYISRR